MDPALYYKIYGKGVDEQAIPRYTKYVEFCHLHRLVEDYVWGD